MSFLATCESPSTSDSVKALVIVVIGVGIYAAIVAALVLRGRRDARLSVISTFAASALLGGVILALPGDWNGADDDWDLRILVGLGAGVLTGLAVYAIRRAAAFRLIAAGIVGAPLVPGGFVLLLIAVLAAGGTCLD
jgi:hypothetical protein